MVGFYARRPESAREHRSSTLQGISLLLADFEVSF
jgi:hypothetical protein